MKNLIPKSFIQDVVARTDIVTVIGTRIELKKHGHTHTACCPFHSEKTPSFSVSQSKQFYYCFGCGAHGNAIGFLMEYDHLSFVDAVTDLANQLGMQVPLEAGTAETSQNDGLYTLLYNAQALYEKELKKSPTAIEYLKNRGLTGQIAKEFSVGYAPNAWEFLSQALGKNKEDRELLTTAGMLIPKENRHYDRFRDRILFPIRDVRGRTIGFGGRTLTNEIPKYLNSPETPVFHKNQTLYGLYEVCQHHRKLQRAIVVEGYLDVIGLAQHNINYAVATLGTALNSKHIQLLLRYTSDIIFCFDGDNAGQKAAWKALLFSLPLLRDGLNIRFLFLPQSEDPDSLVKKIGQIEFEKLIDRATQLPTVFFDEMEKEFPSDSMAGKAAFAKTANEHINTMPQGIYRNLLLDQLANKLNIARGDITAYSVRSAHEASVAREVSAPSRARSHTRLNPAKIAIQLLLQQPSLVEHTSHVLAFNHIEKTPEKILLMNLIDRCKKNPYRHLGELLQDVEDDAERSLFAKIAALPLQIPEEGRTAEFVGALQRLHEQDQAHQLTLLIAKAKENELSLDEKQLLQLLLASKQANNIVEK
ncbi:MAG: DNA primase [Gammaproteobacteria bacterium]|nr:DNA primase [Gammaproteobacteria bacterium]